MYTLPKLNFDYADLEPIIDARTMEIHHTKHHLGYINKLIAGLEEYPELMKKDINELLRDFKNLPDEVKKTVRNNGGGHANHTLFWSILTPSKQAGPSGDLLLAIENSFGSFGEFKKQFETAAAGQFGSGWGWLIKNDKGDLEIITTANQDSPLMDGLLPILGIDVWEHAYYLNYQNRRPDYLSSIWKIINWEQVDKYFSK
ncbi:MAG: superoxide dismutase [Candidatus Pacebacteria bacterium]|nr:superoxide dismutase [Candidatus Paceibacterota bacterium]